MSADVEKLKELIANQKAYIEILEVEARQIRYPHVTADTLTALDGAKKYLARLEGALAEETRDL